MSLFIDGNIVKVSRGVTLKLIFPGFVILVMAVLAALYINIFLSIPVFYVGAVVFLSIQGVFIDLERKRIKPYFNLLFIKMGDWMPLDKYNQLVLSLYRSSVQMSSRASSTTVNTRSFDVFLVDGIGDQLIIDEFTDYDEAKELFDELATLLDLPADNQYEAMLENLSERRTQRR